MAAAFGNGGSKSPMRAVRCTGHGRGFGNRELGFRPRADTAAVAPALRDRIFSRVIKALQLQRRRILPRQNAYASMPGRAALKNTPGSVT
jgi:hypothetical protein